jgi:hypothetical protein
MQQQLQILVEMGSNLRSRIAHSDRVRRRLPPLSPGNPGDFDLPAQNDTVGKDQSHGTFVAPSTGIHGWFWENQSLEPVTIKLISSGFYDYIMQNLNDVKTRLQPADPK